MNASSSGVVAGMGCSGSAAPWRARSCSLNPDRRLRRLGGWAVFCVAAGGFAFSLGNGFHLCGEQASQFGPSRPVFQRRLPARCARSWRCTPALMAALVALGSPVVRQSERFFVDRQATQ